MLCTERLNILPYEASFYDDLRLLFCDSQDVMQWALQNRTLHLEEFENLLKEKFVDEDKPILGFYGVQTKVHQKIIGVSGLLHCNYLNKEDLEFGFILAKEAWGNGYAQELGRFWLRYAADQLKCQRILATKSPNNLASQKVLDKLKMRFIRSMQIPQRGQRNVYLKDLVK